MSLYMPILKNRQVELTSLKTLFGVPVSNKILPLIEVIQEKSRLNSSKNLSDELTETFKSGQDFLVDILQSNPNNSMTPNVLTFLSKVNRNPLFRYKMFESLAGIKNLIPVISYDPNNYKPNALISDYNFLLKHFRGSLAYRIHVSNFDEALEEIQDKITSNDFLILDIGSAKHDDLELIPFYIRVRALKNEKEFKSIICQSNKSKDILNSSYKNDFPVKKIDSSLIFSYKSRYNFDGFGDYAGLSKEIPSNGGGISPGFLFYSCALMNSEFIGYRGITNDLNSFKTVITPAVISSSHWKAFSPSHHEKCPACQLISNINIGTESGRSQSKWKMISIVHYIFSLDEYL